MGMPRGPAAESDSAVPISLTPPHTLQPHAFPKARIPLGSAARLRAGRRRWFPLPKMPPFFQKDHPAATDCVRWLR